MHERNRFTYIAIGLGLGLLLALIFLVWAVPEFRDPSYYARLDGFQAHRLERLTQQELTNGAKWWGRMGSLVSMEDTLANWIIAIFTVVATGVSLIAVILVYRSLGLTRSAVRAADDAVSETRRIGEAQVRAYISVEPMSFGTPDPRRRSFLVPIKFRNTGTTPARNFSFQVKFFVALHADGTAVVPHFDADFPAVEETDFQLGGSAENVSDIATELLSEEDRKLIARHTTHRLYIVGRVSYVDVFNKSHVTYVTAFYCKTGRSEMKKHDVFTGGGINRPVGYTHTHVEIWDWAFTAKGNSAD